VPRVTNQKLAEDLAFLKGKVLSAEENAKEHRSWEISQMDKIEGYLKEQNGRLRTAEVQIGWFKGLAAMFSIIIGYIFKRTL
tara:strand:+ start:83 stop:328 length:246 start_codon:yes stop_codon:yes gene_type:complete